jgi:GMP synthase (glutamine-hydrolysing)
MRVLSVTHGPSVPGGIFEEVVEASGHKLERWVVPLGAAPRSPARYSAVLIFGGSMHPDEDERFTWLAREAEFLEELLAQEVPVIGVCLGAQMLARAAGARVAPARAPEVGWLEVTLTDEGRADPVLGVLPPRLEAFQWHHYTFQVPSQATELARSNVCTQAFRRGRAWALQFHAEVTLPMVRAWTAGDPDDLPVSAADFLAGTEARIADWNEHGRRLCAAFLELASDGS